MPTIRAALDTQDVAIKGDLREPVLKLRNEIALLRKDINNILWTVRIVLGGVIALLVRSFF